ncbi:hypothetical protein ASG87_04290 [Frateuria sp. Soil773]|nr:hypothetical protein ASG87_04290 [Frateuria sp. Soil773]
MAKGDSERLNTDIFYNYKNDPATWQHLSQYIVTLGIDGTLGQADLPNLIDGTTPWPRAVSNQAEAIDDMWHAAINSRGGYFSASDPQKLVESLKAILQDVSAPSGSSAPASLNTAVLVPGALNYPTTYQPSDWTGTVTANDVDLAGNLGTERWNAAKILDALDSPATTRVILTGKYDGTTKKVSGINFDWAALGAGVQQDWLNTVPYSDPATKDANGQDRLKWIRGDDSKEGGSFRTRNSLLGAIINSQTKYVAYPVDGYRNNFPQITGGPAAPETTAMASDKSDCFKDDTCSSYEQFVKKHADRKPVVYVGANDGMLHAFDASQNSDGTSTTSAGKELWAYVPYAVYPNLSKLSSPKFNTAYMPTVDATPVTRDVFFSEKDASGGAHSEWHTILVGGLRYGGRGVYALDITDPTATVSDASSKVLWEFTADSVGADSSDLTKANNPANLGYTFGQPNVGRLANGKWVVLIPSGYFPDCTKLSAPAPCDKPPAAANTTSSLFVVDAQTGALIRELRTPGTVTSYGLTSPVLGDYTNDQIDDVAFAGDLVGNLWKFDLSDPDSSKWTISLAFKPAVNGNQPITVMPRLFPDPMTSRFIVVFGTGKFLSSDDNVSTNAITQSVYGIRDIGSTVQKVQAKGGLTKQTLIESTDTNLPRGLTNLSVPSSGVGSGGWYFDLDITSAKGERVVVTPGALFDTNRAVISTFIPGGDDPCDPGHDGALMVVDAATGGAGSGLSSPSSPAGWGSGKTYQVVGARVKNSPTGGALPIAAAVGGGQLLVPGLTLQSGKTLTIDDAIWRRRSWRELNNDQ